jgi:hypothetical protein
VTTKDNRKTPRWVLEVFSPPAVPFTIQCRYWRWTPSGSWVVHCLVSASWLVGLFSHHQPLLFVGVQWLFLVDTHFSCNVTATHLRSQPMAGYNPPWNQCCQVAEIPAKKLAKRSRGKKLAGIICGRMFAKFCQKWPKKICKKSSLLYSNNKLSETKAKFNFNFWLTLRVKAALMFLWHWPDFSQNWPNFTDVLAQTISGPGSTA